MLYVILFALVSALLPCSLSGTAGARPPPLSSLANLTEIIRSATQRSKNSVQLFVTGGFNGHSRKEVDVFDLLDGFATTVAPLPTSRHGHGAASLNGLVYVVGGFDENETGLSTVDVYIPSPRNVWLSTTSMSTARYAAGVCAFNNKIYAIGGWTGTNALESGEIYDPTTSLWTPMKPMLSKRWYFDIASLRGQIYAVGGHDGQRALRTVERYDPNTHQWSFIPEMEIARISVSVAVVKDKLYAMGGAYDEIIRKSVEVYDPHLNAWEHVKDMPIATESTRATSNDGIIYVVGDWTDNVWVFNTETNVWNLSSKIRLSIGRGRVGITISKEG